MGLVCGGVAIGRSLASSIGRCGRLVLRICHLHYSISLLVSSHLVPCGWHSPFHAGKQRWWRRKRHFDNDSIDAGAKIAVANVLGWSRSPNDVNGSHDERSVSRRAMRKLWRNDGTHASRDVRNMPSRTPKFSTASSEEAFARRTGAMEATCTYRPGKESFAP